MVGSGGCSANNNSSSSTCSSSDSSNNNAFLLTTVPSTVAPATVAASAAIAVTNQLGGSVQNNLTTGASAATASISPGASATTTTHLSAPSEVSQTTAISDRPKAKPVSKKDGKNLRKAAAAAATNTTNTTNTTTTTTATGVNNLSGGQQQVSVLGHQLQMMSGSCVITVSVLTQQPVIQKSPDSNLQRMQQQMQSLSVTAGDDQPQQIPTPTAHHSASTSAAAGDAAAADANSSSTTSSTPQSPQINDKFIKMVHQFPNTALQKFADRLTNACEKPKSPADTPPGMLTSPHTTRRLVRTVVDS